MKKIVNFTLVVGMALAIFGITTVMVSLDSNIIRVDALPTPNCTVHKNVNPEAGKMLFHMPVGIPESHTLEDNYTDTGFVDLYFAKEPMCRDNGLTQTFANGLIRYFEADQTSGFDVEIAGGEKRLQLLVDSTSFPDRVSMGKVNGLPALFIEPGMRNTLVIDEDTNELLETHENWSPGEIRVVDEKNKKYYTIMADLPVSQMKSILENTLG